MKIQKVVQKFKNVGPYPDPIYPEVIQFPVNDICNSKCQMCNIWQQKKERELSLDEIEQLYSNPLFKNVTTIGLNGGEPTLRKDLPQIIERLDRSLPKLNSISLITNSIIHKRVIAYVEEMGKICKDRNLHFDLMCSLDGIGDVHDRVRGRVGNFESVEKVVAAAKNFEGVGNIRIGCTIIKENVFDVENVLYWAIQNGVYARFRIGIQHQRLYKGADDSVFGFNDIERFHLVNFLDVLNKYYEKEYARRIFYDSLKNQLLYNAPRNAGCSWKYRGATVTSKGELAFCAVESDILGNALTEDAEKLFWNNVDHLKEIQQTKCDNCNHDYQGLKTKEQLVTQMIHKASKKSKFVKNSIEFAKSTKKTIKSISSSTKQVYTNAEKGENLNQVLICGWYGTETLGDQAILAQLVSNLRVNKPGHLIHLATLDKTVSEYTDLTNNDCQVDEILSLKEVEDRIANKSYSHIYFGGGPIMSTVSKINDMSYLFRLAKHNNTTTVIYGSGIGPVVKNKNYDGLQKLLSSTDICVNRDDKSATYAKEKISDTTAACDPALIWFRAKYQADSNKKRENRIAYALRDIPFNQYHSEKDKKSRDLIQDRFINEMKNLIINSSDHGFENTELFCMNKFSIGDDDRFFYAKLLDLDGKEKADISLDITHPPVEDYIKRFYNSEKAICMRYHSVCLALATETPFVAIDYTNGGKTKNLLSDLGLLELCVPLEEANEQTITEKLKLSEKLLKDRQDKIHSFIDSAADTYNELLAK